MPAHNENVKGVKLHNSEKAAMEGAGGWELENFKKDGRGEGGRNPPPEAAPVGKESGREQNQGGLGGNLWREVIRACVRAGELCSQGHRSPYRAGVSSHCPPPSCLCPRLPRSWKTEAPSHTLEDILCLRRSFCLPVSQGWARGGLGSEGRLSTCSGSLGSEASPGGRWRSWEVWKPSFHKGSWALQV